MLVLAALCAFVFVGLLLAATTPPEDEVTLGEIAQAFVAALTGVLDAIVDMTDALDLAWRRARRALIGPRFPWDAS